MNKREQAKARFKDVAAMAGGAAVGGGLGYLTYRQLAKSYGGPLRRLPPEIRLKYLVPASTALVGGIAVSKIVKDRAKMKRNRVRAKAKR